MTDCPGLYPHTVKPENCTICNEPARLTLSGISPNIDGEYLKVPPLCGWGEGARLIANDPGSPFIYFCVYENCHNYTYNPTEQRACYSKTRKALSPLCNVFYGGGSGGSEAPTFRPLEHLPDVHKAWEVAVSTIPWWKRIWQTIKKLKK